jgi:hypothetical protein
MHMRRNLLLVAAIAVLAPGFAEAKQCQGVNFPDEMQVDGTKLALNGLGLRLATMLKVKVYVAGLYVAKTSSDPNVLLASTAPSELVLQFVRDVDANDLTKAWSEGFEKSAKSQMAALKDRIGMLNGWMADMKIGQRLSFVVKPGTGVEVNVNGAVKGTIKGDDFAKALLAIWLGSDPPNPEIKTGLLGGACG